ncbi:hypothetical protein Tco_1316400 [Tanacetum coccineum]
MAIVFVNKRCSEKGSLGNSKNGPCGFMKGPDEDTGKQKVSTDKEEVSTDRPDEGTVDQNEGRSATQTAPTTTTPTIFGDDETIAQVLIIMSQNKEKLKEKKKDRGLKMIDPKDKIKKKIEEEDESDTESEGITEAEKKFKQLARDEEVAKKVQEDWEAEEEVKKLAKEEATKAAFSNEYDFIQARLNDDKILAKKLQEEEREISEAIKNKPPSRNQLRNQMMTYLKHVGGKKHSDLKGKTFKEIHVLYERLKRKDQNFVAIGSAEDERQIKELNKDPKKKKLKKRVVNEEDTVKVPAEQEVTEQGTEKEKWVHKVSSPDGNYLVVYRVNGHFRAFNYLMEYSEITPEDIELILWGDLKIMMESSTKENVQDFKDGTIIYMLVKRRYPLSKELLQQMLDLGLEVEEERYGYSRKGTKRKLKSTKPSTGRKGPSQVELVLVVKTVSTVVSAVVVMKQYSEITPEDIELILWGDLKIMMESSTKENDQGEFWNNQQEWEIIRWRLYEAYGVYILELKDGTVIYMLVERRYPFFKELLQRMLDFGLEIEEESTAALQLIRFIKQQLNEE